MKSKLFKVLGVVAVVAMLATALVAPAAAVSGVSASVTAGSAIIGAVGNYTINATLATQLLGTNGVAVTLPYTGETLRFTAAAATDKVAIAISGSIPLVSFGGGTYTGGVVSFTAPNNTVTFTTVAPNTVITYTNTVGNAAALTGNDLSGAPTCSAAPGAYTLPDVGDKIVFTATAAGTATLSSYTGVSVVFAPTTCGSYAAGVITFTAAGTATVSSTTAQISGLWTSTGTAPSGAPGANVLNPIASAPAAANGDTITIAFPTGFTIGNPTGSSIAASAGWVTLPPLTTPTYENAHLTPATTFSFSGQNIIITLGAGDYIGASAQVFINLTAGVTNPSTAGSFTLTVATSQETTAITSNSFTISNPVIILLPGVATVYNTAGVLMSQSNSLTTALGAVAAGGTIKLSAGTYNTDFGTVPCTVAFTLQGTDASAANVVIKSTVPWSLTGATVVIDKVTIDGSTGALTMTNATAGTISNSNLQGAVVTFNGAGTNTLSADNVTVLTGTNGVAAVTPTTVTNCTFSVAGTGVGLAGSANVTVSGSTFTGVSGAGTGVALIGGAASVIGTSKFSTLTTALSVMGGTTGASFNGNTVDKCGVATGPDAIMVTSTSGLIVSNNNITNSLEYIINVAANDNLVTVMANQFSGNTKNAKDAANATAAPLNVTHNYWGGTAANPASVTTAPLISYAMPLGAVPTSGSVEVGAASLDASATAGVMVSAAVGSTTLGAVLLGANPVTTALPSTVTAKSYYDVFGVGTAVTATIQFNGSTAKPIASTDLVYMWNTLYGRWDLLATGANAYGNYVTVTGANISGTVFALVTLIPTVPAVTNNPTPQYPGDGAVNVPIDVTFTWPAVDGATGYQFAIAQDNPDLTNKFAVLDYSANTITNAHEVQETLLNNTTYWWEVRAVNGTIVSPWSIVTFFTTAKASVATSTTTAPPITIVQTTVTYTNPPVTTITYTLPQPKETQPIPSYLLWAVIAVGAVLVIAVIVLIVRTRRMP